MEEQSRQRLSRRVFFGRAAAGAAAGTTLAGVLSSGTAAATSLRKGGDIAVVRQQAEREAFEVLTRSFFEAYDSFDLDRFMSFFHEDAYQQDVALGDLSAFGGPSDGSCSVHPKGPLRQLFAPLFQLFPTTAGGITKFIHATGSVRYGGAVDLKILGNTFFTSGFDGMSYVDIRDGKIFRRNDHWDTAQVSPQDIAIIHPGGQPRLSCEALPQPGDIANASPDFYQFVRSFSGALASWSLDHVFQFLSDDVHLIHPLLSRVSGAYGPFNRGIQIRGRKAVARFFRAAGRALPDGEGSSLIHVAGGSSGGGFEWRSGGVTAQQGIARNGIHGVTAIDIHDGRIERLSVKFDTLQMTPQQRDSIRRALADEGLVV